MQPLIIVKERPLGHPVKFTPLQVDPEARPPSIAQILDLQPNLPAEFKETCVARVNGIIVPREAWPYVRPRPETCKDVVVTYTPPPMGKSGAGIAGIAILLVAALAPYALPLAFPALGTALIGTITGAQLIGAAIGIGGALAVSALTKPPTLAGNQQQKIGGETKEGASLSGNVLSQGAPIPRVIGTHRVFPPFLTPPLIEIVGDDTYAEAVYCLNGPTQITEPLTGNTSVEDLSGVQIEIQEGLPNSPVQQLVRRQSFTDQHASVQMSKHQVDNSSGDVVEDLKNQTNPENSLPKWETFASRRNPDEVWIPVVFPQGTSKNGTGSIFIPFRIRARPRGTDTWINFPEIHAAPRMSLQPFQYMIKFMWQAAPAVRNTPSKKLGFGKAFLRAGKQTVTPVGYGGWTADAYFANSTYTAISAGDGAESDDTTSNTTRWYNGTTSEAAANCATKTGTGTLSMQMTKGYAAPGPSRGKVVVYGPNDRAITNSANKEVTITVQGAVDPGTFEDLISKTFTSGVGDVITIDLNDDFIPGGFNYWRVQVAETAGDAGSHSLCIAEVVWYTSGDVFLAFDNVDTTAVINTELFSDRVEFYLDDDTLFPQDEIWEFQIMRGQVGEDNGNGNNFKDEVYGYTDGVTIQDFFGYKTDTGVQVTIHDQSNYQDTVQIPRISTVWNEDPAPEASKVAVIAVKVKNRSLDQLSVLASSYVYDWDGSGWNDLVISSNPATHYNEILTGNLGSSPVPDALIDNTKLVEWRQHCIDMGYEINAVIEGKTYLDALDLCASCGYAQRTNNELWGVFIDKDRSGESVSNIYNARTMADFSWERAFVKRSSGIRGRFNDSTDLYESRELIVYADANNPDPSALDQISYDGLVTEAEVQARAQFDLEQAEKRFTFYQGTVDLESIVNTKGDLVGLQHDVLHDLGGYSRVLAVQTSGANVTGLVLDGTIPFLDTPSLFANSLIFDEDDLFVLGEQTGIAIRYKGGNGVTVKEINAATTDGDVTEVTFATPFADPGTSVLDVECLVSSGRLGQEYRRVYITAIEPGTDRKAKITFVDEAPELWS